MMFAQEAIKAGVAPKLGVDMAHVDVELFPGSVIADLTIRPPENVSAADVQQQLAASPQDLRSAVAAALNATAEYFEDSVYGAISVSSVDVTPYPYPGTAGAGAATGGHASHASGWASGVAGHIHHHAEKAVEHV